MLSPSLRLRDGVKVDFHAGHDSAHFNLRWISSLSGSANKANLQFLQVYSWPTQTFVSSGKARSFWNAEAICAGVPLLKLPQPLTNIVSPVKTFPSTR